MTNDRRYQRDQIYDLPALPPDATHDELLEHQQREDQWRRTREPVATGSRFLKFLTWQDLVDLGIISANDVVGNDDPDGPDNPPDVNDPDSPAFVNEPRLAVYARDMFLPVTYACSALTVIENANTKPNQQVLLFDPTTYESAQFTLILPKEWPGRALRYRVYWSHGSGATAYGVTWDLTVHSYEDGESMLNVWATGLRVSDTGGTTDDLYITNESEAVTVNGNLAKAHDFLIFRITRVVTDAADTMDVDARLHAIELNIGEVDDDFPLTGGDDDFASVVLLMHGEGADSGTTFIDDSPSAHSVSVSGSPITSTATPKYNLASMKFDGTTGYLNAGTSTDWQFGSGDFTIEFFLGHFTYTGVALEVPIVSLWNPTTGLSWIVTVTILNRLSFFYRQASTGVFTNYSATGVAGGLGSTYKHFAITRSGTTLRIFFDGVIDYTGTITGAIDSATSTPLCIGGTDYAGNLYLIGQLDELRITKGVARYTADFTPPTGPFPNY